MKSNFGCFTALFWLIIAWTLLITSIVLAVQGNWIPAIYFGIMWAGWSNNIGQTITQLRSKQ